MITSDVEWQLPLKIVDKIIPLYRELLSSDDLYYYITNDAVDRKIRNAELKFISEAEASNLEDQAYLHSNNIFIYGVFLADDMSISPNENMGTDIFFCPLILSGPG